MPRKDYIILIVFKSLVLDRNAWNCTTVYKSFEMII